MSTPVVSPAHFACAALSLAYYATHGRTPRQSSTLAGELCRALSVPVFGCDDGAPEHAAETLLFDLQRANALASGARYGKKQKARMDRQNGQILPVAALLKALHCVRYNCDGGEACGETLQPALVTLDAIIQALTDHIVTHNPDYVTAAWFI